MSLDLSGTCPRCGRERVPGPECPHCGVIYAKARAPAMSPALRPEPVDVAASGEALADAVSAPAAVWMGEVEDARRELLIRAVAPPAALAVAWALVSSGAGRAFVRTFLSMWVHELGHAVTAWFCGHAAFPGPWRTPVSEARSPAVVVLVTAALAGTAWRGWRLRRVAIVAAAAAALAVQLVCTVMPAHSARALIAFGGDAGAMMLGAALVATIWSDPEGPLGRGSLRWGFLAIGAAALVDALDTWVLAWRDHGELPLGEIEGVGLSDASTLMEVHGWSANALAGRYVTIGCLAVAALAVTYVAQLARARARARAWGHTSRAACDDALANSVTASARSGAPRRSGRPGSS